MYIYTRRLMPSLDALRGGLRPTMAISDVELSGSDLPATQSMQSSGMWGANSQQRPWCRSYRALLVRMRLSETVDLWSILLEL
jgi:hypothetical protein